MDEDVTLNNSSGENTGLLDFDLGNIRVEDFLPNNYDAVQHPQESQHQFQNVPAPINQNMCFEAPFSHSTQSYQVQLPVQFVDHATAEGINLMGSSLQLNATQLRPIPNPEVANFSANPRIGVTPTSSNSPEELAEMYRQTAAKYGSPLIRPPAISEPSTSTNENQAKPKKSKNPKSQPKVISSKITFQTEEPSIGIVQSQSAVVDGEIAASWVIPKKPRAPRKPQGPRKQKVSSSSAIASVPDAMTIPTASSSNSKTQGHQQLLNLPLPKPIETTPASTQSKSKPPRKSTPRKPKEIPAEQTTKPKTEKQKQPRKPRIPKQSKPDPTKPSDPVGTNISSSSDLSLYFSGSDFSMPTSSSSRLTLHYEQTQARNPGNLKLTVPESLPQVDSGLNFKEQPSFQTQSNQDAGRVNSVNTIFEQLVHKKSEEVGFRPTLTPAITSYSHGSEPNYINSAPTLLKVITMTENNRSSKGSTYVDQTLSLNPIWTHPGQSGNQPLQSQTTEAQLFYKPPPCKPKPAVKTYGPKTSTKLVNPALVPSGIISTTADLTLHEKETLRKLRQQNFLTSLAAGSSDNLNSSMSTEMTPDEVEHLTKYREGRNKTSASKPKKKEKVPKPRLVTCPIPEPRKCTTDKPQKLKPPSKSRTKESSGHPPFTFHAQYPVDNTNSSTYEVVVNSQRPSSETSLQSPTTMITEDQPRVQTLQNFNSTFNRISQNQYNFASPATAQIIYGPFFSPTNSNSTPDAQQKLQQTNNSTLILNQHQGFASNIDSVIKIVSSDHDQRRDITQLVSSVVVNSKNCKDTEGKAKAPRKTYSKPKKNLNPTSNVSPDPGSDSTANIKLTKRGLPRKQKTPRSQKTKQEQSIDGTTGTIALTKGAQAFGSLGSSSLTLNNIGVEVPQDLSISSKYMASESIGAWTNSTKSTNHYSCLKAFVEGNAGSRTTFIPDSASPPLSVLPIQVQGQFHCGPSSSSLEQLQRATPLNTMASIFPVTTNSNLGSSPSLEQLNPETIKKLESDGELTFGGLRRLAENDEKAIKPTGQKDSTPSPNTVFRKLYPDVEITKKVVPIGTTLREYQPGRAPHGNLHNDINYQTSNWNNWKSKSENSKSPKKSDRSKEWTSHSQDLHRREAFSSFHFSTKSDHTKRLPTVVSGTPGDLALIFPIQPLLKGTARIPKLPVLKNKNPMYIGGQGRSMTSMAQIKNDRAMAKAGLGSAESKSDPEDRSSGVWPTLKTKPQKYERKQKPYLAKIPSENVQTKVRSDERKGAQKAHLKDVHDRRKEREFENQSSKINRSSSLGRSGQARILMPKNSREEERNLKKGFGTLWAYTEDERNFLYDEGKYLVKRVDLDNNLSREEIDLWRIEKGFQTLKLYRPQIDHSRIFHVGQETFVPVQKDFNLFRDYQPVYVTICMESKSLQIVQYFQDERFHQHLMFMYQNENLYQDYFHLLQILVCQAMDPDIIKEAILKEPGDVEWKNSWDKTEAKLNHLSEQVARNPRWNQQALKVIRDWPKMVQSVHQVDKTRTCDACLEGRVAYKRASFMGSPYDRTQFFALAEKPELSERDTVYCFRCAIMLRFYSRIIHAKYDIFGCVRQRILLLTNTAAPGTQFDPLNVRDFLMDDHIWVRRMFYDYLIVLAEGYKMVEKLDRENKCSLTKGGSAKVQSKSQVQM